MKGNVRIFAYDVNSKIQNSPKVSLEHGFCVSGQTVRIETFEQLINLGAGRQFTVSKAHQRKARNRQAVKKVIFF